MSEDIVIRQPDPAPHEQSGNILVQEATQAIIANNDDWELAGNVVIELNRELDHIEKEFYGTDDAPGHIKLVHQAWKAGVALCNRAMAPRLKAKEIWVAKRRKFEYDVDQKRLTEQRKAQAQAEEKAKKERENQIREAKRLGDLEAAENLKSAPIPVVVAPPKTLEVPQVEGQRRTAPIWDYEILNAAALPENLKMPNDKAISALVKRLGPQHGIPGISVFDRRSRGAENGF
jgi:hypothetical protein